MSESSASSESNELGKLIAPYVNAPEQAVSPDQEDFIKQHPQFESELRAFLSDLEKLPLPETDDH
ncbi:MAG: hypothetical protein KDB03_12875 [Planctomycetales bacterium]|nr:hypothetical protein [Planctomycetales bacterium]